jgi:hypothetical protein
MQISLNSSINQPKQNFKALKSIKFDGKALENSYRAQKELLTILEQPNIKKVCEKFDSFVEFGRYYDYRYSDFNLYCEINVRDNIRDIFSRIKQEYIEKAKNMNVSSEKFEDIKFTEDHPKYSYDYLRCHIYQPYGEDIVVTSKRLSETVKKEMNNPEKYNKELTDFQNNVESGIRRTFDNILKEEIKSLSDKNEEALAQKEISNKLKELLK